MKKMLNKLAVIKKRQTIRLIFSTLLFFIYHIGYSQSDTLTNTMDTTIIGSKITTSSILLISSGDFKLYLNKKYFIDLITDHIKWDKKSFIRFLKSFDSISLDNYDFFYDKLNDNPDFIIRDIMGKCIQKGEFLYAKDKFGNVYNIILNINNNNHLDQQKTSCIMQYLEYMLPDKETSIFIRIAHSEMMRN